MILVWTIRRRRRRSSQLRVRCQIVGRFTAPRLRSFRTSREYIRLPVSEWVVSTCSHRAIITVPVSSSQLELISNTTDHPRLTKRQGEKYTSSQLALTWIAPISAVTDHQHDEGEFILHCILDSCLKYIWALLSSCKKNIQNKSEKRYLDNISRLDLFYFL